MIGSRQPPVVRTLLLARGQAGRLALAALAGALATGCAVALLAVSGFLLARASQHPAITALSIAVVSVRALSIGRGGFRYAERLASHDVAFRVLARARVATWRRLEALAPAGLGRFSSGDLLSRIVADVDATSDVFLRGITPPLAAALAGGGAVLACLALLVPAGLVLAAGLLTGGLGVPAAGLLAARSAARRTSPLAGQFGSALADALAGAADLQAFGAQELALGRIEEANAGLLRMSRRSAAAAGIGTGLASLGAGVTVWAVLLLGVAAVQAGTLSRVPLAVLTLTALASFEAVTTLPAAAIQLAYARTAAGRIAAVTDVPDPVREPDQPRPAPAQASAQIPVRIPAQLTGAAGPRFEIRLRDARVRYSPGGPLALDGVSLDLLPGRRIALVGPTGAGKSTVASVLLRFCELSGGSATLNGHDLAEYDSDQVRALIGGYAHDPYLFQASIRENLALARPGAGDPELAFVARRAGLLTWIESLPEGWETTVGAGGSAVSGGQRQRIALARALLADPAVLILDEPVSHLDPRTRRELTADLLRATAGRATLLITHYLGGLDQVDEIIVLDRGQVAERGTHAGLLAAHGSYHRMLEAATGPP